MAKKAPQPPWVQAQQMAVQLGELFDQMEMDPSVTENDLTAISRHCLARLRKLAKRGLAGGGVRVAKRPPRSPWLEVIDLGTGLKGELEMIGEDSDVETGLWHNALVLTNRLLRLARKELAGLGGP